MKFQVVLTVDEKQLGPLLALLPKGTAHEISKLVEREARGDGKFPSGDTIAAKVLKLFASGPISLSHAKKSLHHKPNAVSSAFYSLRNRGLIRLQANGLYARVK